MEPEGLPSGSNGRLKVSEDVCDSDETDGKEAIYRKPRTTNRPWTQDISIFIARFADHSTQPSLGN